MTYVAYLWGAYGFVAGAMVALWLLAKWRFACWLSQRRKS